MAGGGCTVFLLALALCCPRAASGATVKTVGGCDRYSNCGFQVTVVAARSEAADLVLTSTSTDEVTVTDRAGTLEPGPRCHALDPRTASCTAQYLRSVSATLGDENDRFDASGLSRIPVVVKGGAGSDTILGSPFDDDLQGGPGDDSLTGGGGNDTADYTDHRGPVYVDLATQTERGPGGERDQLAGIDSASGGSGDDVLLGDDGNNRLAGGPGDDVLRGRRGNDSLEGGRGADILVGGLGDDTLGNLGEAPRGAGHDHFSCGQGRDSIEPVTDTDLILDGCEELWPDVFLGPWFLDPKGAHLAIRRDYPGPPATFVVKARIAGTRRAFRAFRAHVPDDRRASSHGAFHIDLSPPAVDRLRRRQPVTVIVSVRARTPDIHFTYHDVLRFRLARRA